MDEIKFLEKIRSNIMNELLQEGYTIKDLSFIFNTHPDDIEKIIFNK